MTGIFIFFIFAQCVFLLGAYTLMAPWWRTRSGTAYFGLIVSLAVLSGHFLIEELVGQQPEPVEDIVLGLVAAAIVWNAYTIIWKQLHYWRKGHPTTTHNPISREP